MLTEILEQALQGTSWEGQIDVRHVDGSVQPAEVVCTPLRRGHEIVGTLWVSDYAVGEAEQVREIRRLGDRLRRLAAVAADLGTADTIDAVTKIVIDQAADAVGATVASLSLKVDDETMVLAGLRGGLVRARRSAGRRSRSTRRPPRRRRPHRAAARAARGRRDRRALPRPGARQRGPPVDGRAAAQRPRPDDRRDLAVLPGSARARCRRARVLRHPRRLVRPGDRAHRLPARRGRSRRLAMRFLADSAAELSNSLDYGRTLSRVAKLAVPEFADWCAIDLVEDGRLHRLAVEHVDPAKVELALEMQRRYPPDPESGGTWEVIRTGQAQPGPRHHRRDARGHDQRPGAAARWRAPSSCAAASSYPWRRAVGCSGAMTWVISDEYRHYTEADALFAEELARRCALAIDNSQLYSQTLETAVQLQHAVLPDLTEALPGWTRGHPLQPGRTHRRGRRLLRRHQPARRTAGALRGRRHGPRRRGGRLDGADACGDPRVRRGRARSRTRRLQAGRADGDLRHAPAGHARARRDRPGDATSSTRSAPDTRRRS